MLQWKICSKSACTNDCSVIFYKKNEGSGKCVLKLYNRYKKEDVVILKKIAGVVVFLGFLLAMAPLHLSNVYLRSADFEVVTVGQNDSVWSIAERYTTDTDQTGNLREAIIEVNDLKGENALRFGQTLRVPVLARQAVSSQLAEK